MEQATLDALKAFATAAKADPDSKGVVEAFQKEAQPISQHFVNMGHGIERENSKQAIQAATDAKVEAENKLTEANSTIEKLQADKPDIAGMQRQHQEALDNRSKEHQKAMTAEKEKTRKFLMQRDLGYLQGYLTGRKVEPEIAKNLTFENSSLPERIKHDEEGLPTVFQAGTQTPYSVAQGQQPLDPLGEELLKRVPKGAFTEEVDTGSEISGHKGDAGGKGGKPTLYDQIREKKSAEEKAITETDLTTRRDQKFGRAQR